MVTKEEWERHRLLVEELNGVNLKSISQEDKDRLFKKFILSLHEEATELLKTTNYKEHDNMEYVRPKCNTLLELVDVHKYTMSLMVLLGIDPEDFNEMELMKHEAVEQRFRERQLELEDQKFVMIDIDGVIADYPKSFYEFAEKHYGIKCDASQHDDYDICKALCLTRKQYERIKYKYRESGQKKDIPLVRGAYSGLKRIKRAGYKIVLFTARPVSKHSRIEVDTLHWLKKNLIPFDMVLYGEHKHEVLSELFKDKKPKFFVEDNGGNAKTLAGDGINVILIDKKYNQGVEHPNITRIKEWSEVLP